MGFLTDAGRTKSVTVAALLCFELNQPYLAIPRNLMHANTSKTTRIIVLGLWILFLHFFISTSKSTYLIWIVNTDHTMSMGSVLK
jgi:hypothetical protein